MIKKTHGHLAAGVECCGWAASANLAELWMTPLCSDWTAPADNGFLADLQDVLTNSGRIAVAYDFRSYLPDEDFMRGLTKFFKEYLDLWMDRLKSFAVIIQENVLDATAKGPVANFLRACPSPPGCPFVICHSTGMASQFFQAVLEPQSACPNSAAQFYSVVDILDDPRTRPGRRKHPFRKVGACLASLAPSPSPTEACSQMHMLHELPNGDTQVIQSPPQDVVVRMDPGLASLGRWAVDEVVKPLAPDAEDEREDCTRLAALAFECPREELLQLVGAHFHVGELFVDAETESALRTPWRCHNGVKLNDIIGLVEACFAGISTCLHEALEKAARGSVALIQSRRP